MKCVYLWFTFRGYSSFEKLTGFCEGFILIVSSASLGRFREQTWRCLCQRLLRVLHPSGNKLRPWCCWLLWKQCEKLSIGRGGCLCQTQQNKSKARKLWRKRSYTSLRLPESQVQWPLKPYFKKCFHGSTCPATAFSTLGWCQSGYYSLWPETTILKQLMCAPEMAQ